MEIMASWKLYQKMGFLWTAIVISNKYLMCLESQLMIDDL